ncbi:glycosyltransferase family 4 protein [Salinispora tropica]|uniref:Glycosyl transferase, group 1 n=1 Tax=Salinispora tropica (strain ATCC BAA-916 / DSM 44818 / JCM 13857 / NBRC 105044 / CNB-440) TaxID=369723 RepID=A4X6N1_SALTO|nr:glycosyltransferase family 4 protein [Salinispora tropica]ABP54531.1 glycosyl transferase, group 1 [Salinispora tropica CNB-440]
MHCDGVAAAGRGRVVMLVDNSIDGDSRVQKAARSAADAGWDVTLLGCGDTAREGQLGTATVRVLAMPRPAARSGVRQRLVARGGALLRVARLLRRPSEYVQVLLWHAISGDRAWRRLEPGLWTYERVFGPVVDAVAPDLIHAHDFRMLGVAARAVERAEAVGRQVRLVWDAHEWLAGARPRRDNVRWLPAHLAYLREYVPRVDGVVTVSAALADLLRSEYRLAEEPTVLLNAPAVADPPPPDVPDLRARCGVGPETPLLVYSGALAEQRGVGTVIEALPRLPDVHLALVVGDVSAPYLRQLLDVAARLGVADRVHPQPYVPHQQVSAFLSAADVGLIPLHHWPNHEIALITKFFEYAHARLPIVVSDVQTMADTVRATGQGEVFRARDVGDLVRAVQAVLAEPQRYRRSYDGPDSPLVDWTWEAQVDRLDALYRRLLSPTVESVETS